MADEKVAESLPTQKLCKTTKNVSNWVAEKKEKKIEKISSESECVQKEAGEHFLRQQSVI
jgi:hypothetical protein